MTLWISDRIKFPRAENEAVREFLEQFIARRTFGHVRYGSPKKEQRYMSRLAKELQVYKKTGNRENLLNIAVYAFLEGYAPENKKYHFNPNVDSATRSTFGGARE